MRFLRCRFNIRVQFCTENFFHYMAEYVIVNFAEIRVFRRLPLRNWTLAGAQVDTI